MAMTVTVRFNSADAQRALAKLAQRAPLAIVRSLNRAATSAKTVMVRAISKDLALRQTTVRDAVFMGQAKPDQLVARVGVTGKRIPLIEFNAKGPEPSRGKGRGVTARIGGQAKRYPNAFIATMRSGHRGVFTRVRGSRLPIAELRGPSLPLVFSKHLDDGLARGQEQLVKNLVHEFSRVADIAATA